MPTPDTTLIRIETERPLYAWAVACLFSLTQMFSFVDRQILSLLIGPIRADLGISDTQVALLHGFAFVLFYSIMGIPLGRLADRGDRPVIIAIGLAFWSLATAACGIARNFWTLFVARMCVGVGEASLSPSALSLLADYFPKSKLGRAVGLYMAGIYLGSGAAYILGGAVTQWAVDLGEIHLPVLGLVRGWQVTFFVVGLPGVLLTLAYLFVMEPRRASSRYFIERPRHERLADVWQHLWTRRTAFVSHYVGFGIVTALLYAMMFWVPQTFVRIHETSIAQAGLYFGIAMLVFGPLGTLSGGWMADRGIAAGRVDAPLKIAAFGFAMTLPAVACFALAPSLSAAVILCMPLAFFLGFPLGIATSSLQLMLPDSMRGQGAGIYYVTVNIIGFTTGPLSVALFTDYLFADDKALHHSLILSSLVFAPIGALLLWTGRKAFAREVTARMDDDKRGSRG